MPNQPSKIKIELMFNANWKNKFKLIMNTVEYECLLPWFCREGILEKTILDVFCLQRISSVL